MKRISNLISEMTSNMISLLGVIIATLTGFSTPIFILALQLEIFKSNYIGILTYLILPGIFAIALLMIPAGIFLKKRREKKEVDEGPKRMPVIDLNNATHRFRLVIITFLTIINIIIITVAFLVGVNYMNTVSFCGEVCHTVMQPEYISYRESPHSRVKCVECHIGGGASWFVKSKLSGLAQVIAVIFNTYPKPVPSPIKDLRPARDTCEQCHWPEVFHGEKRIINTRYKSDEKNTPYYNVLALKIGGKRLADDKHVGIHWHVGKFFSIKYKALDDKKNNIGWVQFTSAEGTKTFLTEEYKKLENKNNLPVKEMDCIDCHNRPTHRFLDPGKAIDNALTQKAIDIKLPWIKREGLKALKTSFINKKAEDVIPQMIAEFYKKNYPGKAGEWQNSIKRSAKQLVDIYKKNIFPEMHLGWGQHLSNIGHNEENAPGCFRCHTDEMETEDGKEYIDNDCDLCHDILAEEETNLDQIRTVLTARTFK